MYIVDMLICRYVDKMPPTLHTSSPEQKESGSSASGLQSHLDGRHLHITHLEQCAGVKIFETVRKIFLTLCPRGRWRPRPPRRSRSPGRTPDTRTW